MGLGLGLLVAGWLLAPAWFLARGTTPLAVYVAGLVAVSVGALLLALQTATALRAARASGVTSSARVNLAAGVLGLAVVLLGVEVVAVVAVNALGQRAAVDAFRARQTQTTMPRKVAHPFLIITNNPALPAINALGFSDRDHERQKPVGTIRIACLGGSTTEDGYPQRLEAVLARELPDVPVEVLNFGVGYWTTAQTLINYALNAKYFAPDYLIVHDGANEHQVRSHAEFRTDYAHALHPMDIRLGWDAPLVRHLQSYALLKLIYLTARGLPPALHAGAAIQVPRPPRYLPLAPHELEPFRENLTELIYMARRRDTEVVFVTQPYSKTQPGWHREWEAHMASVNGIVRTLADETGALVVDLDPEMTGREEYFIDALHLTSDAISIKAEKIAAALVPILRERKAPQDSARGAEGR